MSSDLITYFPQYLTVDSLFSKMQSNGAPWPQEVATFMDDAYFTMWSGVKLPSQFVILHSTDGVADSATIAKIIYSLFGENWNRLWKSYTSEYSPLQDYSLEEKINRGQTSEGSNTSTTDYTSSIDGTGKITDTGSSTTETESESSDTSTSDSTATSTVEHGHVVSSQSDGTAYNYGFNSTEKVPSSSETLQRTDTNSGTDTTTDTSHSTTEGTNSVKGTDNVVSSDERNSTSTEAREDKTATSGNEAKTLNEDITRSRSGITGRITYQELLTQEFELWQWNFYKHVFEDVDSFLTLSVYSTCGG